MSKLSEIREELLDRFNQSIVFHVLSSLGISPRNHPAFRIYMRLRYGVAYWAIWEDYYHIYLYDKKKQKGWERLPLPELWSKEGEVMLARLLEAYEEENPSPKPPHYPGWTCSCGRENQHYVSTCVCGKSKQDVSNKEK